MNTRERSELECARFFNLSPNILGIMELDGSFCQINSSISSILGYSPEEFLICPFIEFIHPDDQEDTLFQIKCLTYGLSNIFFENRCQCKDGSYKWISWTTTLVKEEGQIYIAGQDITEKKQAEIALEQLNNQFEAQVQERSIQFQKSHQELLLLLENSPLAVIKWNSDFRVQEWSSQAEKLFGWNLEEVFGKHPSEWKLIHEEGQEVINKTIEGLLDGTQSQGICCNRNYTKSQSLIYCEWYFSALLDETGKLIAVLSLVLDVTERKLAEQALQGSQKRFSTAFHSSPVPLCITTFPEGQHLDVNESWVFNTGYSHEEVIGCNWAKLEFWQNCEEQKQFIQLIYKQGFVRNMRVRTKVKSGEIRVVLLSSHLTELDGIPCLLNVIIDITKRKQAENTLQRNERRFRALVENAFDATSLIAPDGTMTYASPNSSQILGWTAEEIVGQNAMQLVYPADSETFQNSFASVLSQPRKVLTFITRLQHKDGSFRWIEGAACNLLNEISVQAVVFNFRDVTERKQTEELLKQQLAAIEASIDGIAILDSEQRYTYLNKAHAELFGYSNSSELVGKTWREIYDSNEIHRFEHEIFPIFLQQGYWRGQAIAKGRDNSSLPQEVTLTKLENGGLTCICRDITERKQFEAELEHSRDELELRVQERTEELCNTNLFLQKEISRREKLTSELAISEEALRQSEARLQAFLDNAETVISLKDIEGRYLLVNQKFLATHNLSQNQIIGKTSYDLFSPEVADRTQLSDQQVWETGSSSELEESIQQYGGLRTYLSVKFPLLGHNGVPYAIGCISTDITARKQAEAKILQALEKEKELNELKTRFITNTSHEFRTPLTTILGSAELLEVNRQTLTDDKRKKHCNRIKFAVQHMTQLLDDILTISKAEAGKLHFAPTVSNIQEFCRNLIEDLKSGIGNHHSVSFSSTGKTFTTKFDEKLLRQILENLLANAIKYSPEGGNILLSLQRNEEAFIFQVQDEGIGIPQGDINRLFDPFHRASNVGTISGTGLGLAIVQRAVELHQGEITVESQVGKGSLFTVKIPLMH